MAKELIWSEDSEKVYGWKKDYKTKDEFVSNVKSQYEDGECVVTNVKEEVCICTCQAIPADIIMPLTLADVSIENFYTADVTAVD
jgi:hypothetical protein